MCLFESVSNTHFMFSCRSDKHSLQQEVQLLRDKLERALIRQQELEEQSGRAATLQDKMRERLRQMDQHAQHCATQVS